jgi:hypothetical protein
MSEETKECSKGMWHHGRHNEKIAGVVWFGGWLFTMAFAKLLWWQCIVGLVIWPYYLGRIAR